MAGTINQTMTARQWGMLLTLSAIWGGSFFFVVIALRDLPPFTLVLLRVGIAAVILHGVMRIMRIPVPRQPRIWAAFLAMGLLNNAIPFSLLVWGQTHIASGLAAILNATTPLFGVIVAHCLTDDEPLTGNRLAGALAGFAGAVVMIGPSALEELGTNLVAQIACLVAAMSYAVAGVFGRRFRRMGISPMATAMGQVTGSTLILTPVALTVDQPWLLPMPGLPAWAAVVGLATLCTATGYILYFRILAGAGATNLLLVTFLAPISAILLGAVVLGERLGLRHIAGIVLIGIGLAAIDGRLLRLVRRSRPVAADAFQGQDI
jgi:drug/metabolite transporter (DMT)-like permease